MEFINFDLPDFLVVIPISPLFVNACAFKLGVRNISLLFNVTRIYTAMGATSGKQRRGLRWCCVSEKKKKEKKNYGVLEFDRQCDRTKV